MPDNPLNDLLINLAAEMTVRVMDAGASRLKEAAFGGLETEALRRVYNEALLYMLREEAADLPEDDQQHLDTVMRAFVTSDEQALLLFDLVARRADPPRRALKQAFEAAGGDTSTIPFDRLLTALLEGLDEAMRAEAARSDSALFNRLVVLQLDELLDRSDTLAAQVEQALTASGDHLDIDVGDVSADVAVIGRDIRVTVHKAVLPDRVLDRIVALADAYEAAAKPAPAPVPDEVPTVDPDKADYVFLSYARPDVKVAEVVQAYLEKAGFRVFRDMTAIRGGANWDMTIERALQECGRMVLLVSNSSMPYRKEVYREWRYFDNHNKPLHPLYIETADTLHSRIELINWVDARDDLYAGVARLVEDLTLPYTPLPPTETAGRITVDEEAARRPLSSAFSAASGEGHPY